MKTRERLKRIKRSKSWTERKALAQDHIPGTRHDGMFGQLMGTYNSYQTHRPAKRQSYCINGFADIAGLNHDMVAAFGEDILRAMHSGNSALLREWADTTDAWHSHEPLPDKLRLSIIRFCVPPTGKFQMREIIKHLREQKMIKAEIKESAGLAEVRRNIRRICGELGIKIKGEPGRPKNGK